MEFRHLRFFLTLADELHFTRAAALLGIAQPYLSQEIRRLERELGVELFARTQRRVEITAAGLAFREHARSILRESNEAIDAARRAARGETGRLSIGFAGSVGYDVFPEAIRRLRARWPDVALTLREMTTADQMQRLRAGAIDIGVGRPRREVEPGLEIDIVRHEAAMVALPSNHPLAHHPSLDLPDLAGDAWLVFDRTAGPGLYTWLMETAEAAGFTPVIAQEAGQIPTMVNLVATGLGIALVPESVQRLTREGVVYRRMGGAVPSVLLAVLWRRGNVSPLVANLRAVMREVAAEI